MSEAFRIEGRLVRHDRCRVVRDETRRAEADTYDEALRLARQLLADGFTVWIWTVDGGTVPVALELVQRLTPAPTSSAGRSGPRAPNGLTTTRWVGAG